MKYVGFKSWIVRFALRVMGNCDEFWSAYWQQTKVNQCSANYLDFLFKDLQLVSVLVWVTARTQNSGALAYPFTEITNLPNNGYIKLETAGWTDGQ